MQLYMLELLLFLHACIIISMLNAVCIPLLCFCIYKAKPSVPCGYFEWMLPAYGFYTVLAVI